MANIDLLSLGLGGLTGALVVILALVPYVLRLVNERATLGAQIQANTQTQAQMGQMFEGTAAKVVQNAQEQLLLLAREKLGEAHKDAAHDLEKRQRAVADLVDPVTKKMQEIEVKLQGLDQLGTGLRAQLQSFADDQRQLRAQTTMLAGALKNSSARGQWGEMQLKRTLEIVGLVEGQHYHQQKSVVGDDQTMRPDIVVDLPGKISIVIDAKVPLDPYWALEDQHVVDDNQLRAFRAVLRDHVKRLGAKDYWRQFNSPEFVVMFLPTEALFAQALASDRGLIEEAAAHNVIIAAPTTMLGLLRIVGFAWQQQKLADNARSIGALAQDLSARVEIFIGHLTSARKNLVQAMGGYDRAVASLNARVMPQLRKMAQARGKNDDDLPDQPLIEADEILSLTDDKAA